jgi:hypothetical protein
MSSFSINFICHSYIIDNPQDLIRIANRFLAKSVNKIYAAYLSRRGKVKRISLSKTDKLQTALILLAAIYNFNNTRDNLTALAQRWHK